MEPEGLAKERCATHRRWSIAIIRFQAALIQTTLREKWVQISYFLKVLAQNFCRP